MFLSSLKILGVCVSTYDTEVENKMAHNSTIQTALLGKNSKYTRKWKVTFGHHVPIPKISTIPLWVYCLYLYYV